MLVTPLQMALVAATIANHGREPVPYLVQKVTAPNGSVVSKDQAGHARASDQREDRGGS